MDKTLVFILFLCLTKAGMAQDSLYTCILGSDINGDTGFDTILDTVCIGDTMVLRWSQYHRPERENFTFSWINMEAYFYVLSPTDRDSLVVVPHSLIPLTTSWPIWRSVIRWHDTVINTIDSCFLSNDTFPIYCSPESVLESDVTEICVGDCVSFTNKSPHLPSEFEWYFEGGVPSTYQGKDPPMVCYPEAGTYSVRLISRNSIMGEADTLQLNNYIHVYTAPAVPLLTEQHLQLDPDSSLLLLPCTEAMHYDWLVNGEIACADCPAYPLHATTDQSITCIAYNDAAAPCRESCWYSVAVITLSDGILLPNAFSPNNDGINDCFRALARYATVESIHIYDRWGQMVFESEQQDFCWDGTQSNGDAPISLYAYIVQYKRWADGKSYLQKGMVQLIR